MNICVYGASSNMVPEKYIEATEGLGRELAKAGNVLVFGAGASGMMGAAARGVYELKGKIIGVVPSFFNVDGILFENCTEMIFTETMRERKQKMEDISDGFVMTPGGMGTFDEFFEILTLKELSRHTKAIAVYNVDGYFNDIIRMLEKAIDEGFMKPKCRELFATFENPKELVEYLNAYNPQNLNIMEFKNM